MNLTIELDLVKDIFQIIATTTPFSDINLDLISITINHNLLRCIEKKYFKKNITESNNDQEVSLKQILIYGKHYI